MIPSDHSSILYCKYIDPSIILSTRSMHTYNKVKEYAVILYLKSYVYHRCLHAYNCIIMY